MWKLCAILSTGDHIGPSPSFGLPISLKILSMRFMECVENSEPTGSLGA